MQKHTLTQLRAIQQNNKFYVKFLRASNLLFNAIPFKNCHKPQHYGETHPPFPYKYEFGLPVLPRTAVNDVV